VTINGTIQSGDEEEALIPNFDNLTTADYVWTEGGTLNGGTLTSDSGSSHTLFINNENDWPEAGDGANAATINDTTINSASRFVVYAQPVHADVTLNNTTLNGDRGGILAEFGGNVYLNDVTVNAAGNDENAWINSAVAVGNGTTVNIDGGSYTGTNAVTVCSSGATVNIYDGYFDGNLFNDAGANGHINIYGGTFTVDPTQYVDTENYDVVDNGDGTWTVQEKEVATTNYHLFVEGDYAIISSTDTTGLSLSLTDDNGNEITDGVTYDVSSANAVAENGAVKAGENVTMSAPLEAHTVTAFVDGAEAASTTVYMYDASAHSLYDHSIVKLESGNAYCFLDSVISTYIQMDTVSGCVWKYGDDVSNIYAYEHTMNVTYDGLAKIIEEVIYDGDETELEFVNKGKCPHFDAYAE